MKKNRIIALFIAVILAIVCTGCNSGVTTATPDTNIETDTKVPTSPVVTNTPTHEATTTPTQSTPTPEPTDTHVDPDRFKNTYWINIYLEIGYFFGEDGRATVFMAETKSESTYSFSEDALTLDGMPLPYLVKDDQLIITFFDGIDVALDKATKDQFNELIKEPDITPSPDTTEDSDYIGLTVKEFVKMGADISGYMGFNGEYEFTAYNTEKNEKYTFSLTGGDIKEALNSKTFDDEYEDVLGEFVISEITVIKLDSAELQKYVGKTIAEFESEGFDVNGFMYAMNLTLFAYDENNNSVEITLNGNTNEVYEGLEDPFDEDMGEVFAKFTIKTIKYSSF